MQKEAFLALVLISIILFSNLAYAQTYSGFDKFKDNIELFFTSGDNKVKLALEIREKELNSAIDNAKLGNTRQAIKNIEAASDKLGIVQESASSDMADEVKLNVEEIIKKIMESKDIDPEFSAYLEKHLTEEQKTQLTAGLSEKLFTYCSELAKQDPALLEKDEKCNPENAPGWLKDKINEKMKESQQKIGEEMISQLTTCMTNPKECDCSKIPVTSEQAKCEKAKAFMIRCEFQNDKTACDELEKLGPPTPPSDMPAFLRPLFQKKIDELIKGKEKEMFKKFAPPECVDAGATSREACEAIMMEKYAPKECIEAGATTKEECEKIMFAIHGPPPTECMENGEFIGPEACEEKMVKSGKIPQECIKDNKPIPREECEKIMMEKHPPPEECIKEGRFIGEEECEKIMKEKGPISGQIPQECIKDGKPVSPEECQEIMKELGIQPPQPEGMQKRGWGGSQRIPQECVGLTFDECEKLIMEKYIPKECQEKNALTPEACMKTMLPPECQGKAFSREECEKIMMTKNMPKECQEEGILEPEECAKVMAKNMVRISPKLETLGIDFDQLPSVCKKGINFIRGMECDKALAEMGITLPQPSDISNIPKECIKDGKPVSPEECQEILKNKFVENIPGECREAGITEPDECGRFMEKQRREQGIGINMPPECVGKNPEECKVIMEEKGMRVERVERVERICREGEEGEECRPAIQEQKIEKGERIERMPRECVDMGVSDSSSCDIIMSKVNEERMKNGDKMIIDKEGEQEYISNDELNKIAENAEKRAEEIKPDLEQAQEFREEIDRIEQNIQQIETQQQIQAPEQPSGESRGEGGGESSGGEESLPSESTPTGQVSLLLGNAIRNIQIPSDTIQKILEFIFGRKLA